MRPLILACAMFGMVAAGAAQSSPFGSLARSTDKAQAVAFLYPEQVTVQAGKAAPVALHFRIAPGLHINSHAPKDEFLIPTSISFPAESGVKLEGATYPPGRDFTLPADPKSKLNVYTGEFTIDARLLAQPGDHLVQAKLRYQACDQAQCMPPKTLSIAIDVKGK